MIAEPDDDRFKLAFAGCRNCALQRTRHATSPSIVGNHDDLWFVGKRPTKSFCEVDGTRYDEDGGEIRPRYGLERPSHHWLAVERLEEFVVAAGETAANTSSQQNGPAKPTGSVLVTFWHIASLAASLSPTCAARLAAHAVA